MSKLWRALIVSAAATGVVAAGWTLIARWAEKTVQAGEGVAGVSKQRSHEELVDDLSAEHKQQMLDELSQQF